MGQMLHAKQSELQHAVHTRLDAVTDRLGQSMQATTKQTTDNLQKLNERLAVIDSAQKNITDLASQVTSLHERARQQAAARRLRPGPHGNDHPGRPGRRAPTNSSSRSRTACGRIARSSCPTSARS